MFIKVKDKIYNFQLIVKIEKDFHPTSLHKFKIVFTETLCDSWEPIKVSFDSKEERDAEFERISKLLLPSEHATDCARYANPTDNPYTWSWGTNVVKNSTMDEKETKE